MIPIKSKYLTNAKLKNELDRTQIKEIEKDQMEETHDFTNFFKKFNQEEDLGDNTIQTIKMKGEEDDADFALR